MLSTPPSSSARPQSSSTDSEQPTHFEIVDIAVNLSDEKFDGYYALAQETKRLHAPDHAQMLARTFDLVHRIPVLTSGGRTTSPQQPPPRDLLSHVDVHIPCCLTSGGGLLYIEKTLRLMNLLDPKGERLFTCVGVHPTMVKEFLFLPEELVEKGPGDFRISVRPEVMERWLSFERAEGTNEDLLRADDDDYLSADQSDAGQRRIIVDGPADGRRPDSSAAKNRGKKGKGKKASSVRPTSPQKTSVGVYGFSDDRVHRHFAATDPALKDHPQRHLDLLRGILQDDAETFRTTGRRRIRAVGEMGLDWQRTNYCGADLQKRFFRLQIPLAIEFDLPIFAHIRGPGCYEMFFDVLAQGLADCNADETKLRGGRIGYEVCGTYSWRKGGRIPVLLVQLCGRRFRDKLRTSRLFPL